MRIKEVFIERKNAMVKHVELLGHKGFGVTELRIFKPRPMVAYIDNPDSVVHLVQDMSGFALGFYVGVQPRPLQFFDKAPNRWVTASKTTANCAGDDDIEYITACFWDIDVASFFRKEGHPASEEELLESLDIAYCLSREVGSTSESTICLSGNGHYVITPIVPIAVNGSEIPDQFRICCQFIANEVAGHPDTKLDPVFNLSRVMRLMGTYNLKGVPIKDRPHRTANFVTEPTIAQSMSLHHRIINTEIPADNKQQAPQNHIKCDPAKIESCEFIKWCRIHAINVTEPQWFAMITNLALLPEGEKLIHEISRMDMFRYNYRQTQKLLERVQKKGYCPTTCRTIQSYGFYCPKFGICPVRAPMYMTQLSST